MFIGVRKYKSVKKYNPECSIYGNSVNTQNLNYCIFY